MGQRFLLAVLLTFSCLAATAQTFEFARLQGNPVNMAGWTATGAQATDTRGDSDTDRDEVLIVGTPGTFRSGAIFYNQSLNLGSCQKFEVEFDFRLFDGQIGPTGADGMAFCFLTEPPRGFLNGGGVGIPPRPQGLMVVLDQWCNCCNDGGAGAQKIEIRYGNGRDDYAECPPFAQPTAVVTGLRQNAYQHLRIRYDEGFIQVFRNNSPTPVITGNYILSFPGFVGFTAATGSRVDNHSIKNVVIRTVAPIAPPNAGPDVRLCSGDTAILGAGNSSHPDLIYTWFPPSGLANPNAGNTQISLTNTGFQDISRNYFLSKDSTGRIGGQCSSSDAVRVTVTGTGLDLPQTLSGCSGQRLTVPFTGILGYQYEWNADPAIVSPTVAGTDILLYNPTGLPITRQYILRARAAQYGCQNWASDTVTLTISPSPKRAGPDKTTCPNVPVILGDPPATFFTHTWNSPALPLSIQSAQITVSLPNESDTVRIVPYWVQAQDHVTGCLDRDTVLVRVNPKPVLSLNSQPVVCAGSQVVLGDSVLHPNHYRWSPGRLLSDSLSRRPIVRPEFVQNPGQLTFQVQTADTLTGCIRIDTVTVIISPVPVAEAGPPPIVCGGTSFFLGSEPEPGVSYSWSPDQFLSRPDTAAPRFSLPADTLHHDLFYRVTATLNGCRSHDSVVVTILPQPVANILPFAPPCVGDSLTLSTADRPGYTYLWPLSGHQTAPTIRIPITLAGVNYNQTVVVRGPNGCTARDSVAIAPNNPPPPLAGPDRQVCPLAGVALGEPPVSSLSYQWQPLPGLAGLSLAQPTYTALTFSVDSATHAWAQVLVEDHTTHCLARDSVRITIKQAPQADAGPDRTYCAGSPGWIGAGALPGHTYSWLRSPFLGGRPDSSFIRIQFPADTLIQQFSFFRTAFLDGCPLTDTVQVTAAPLPAYTPRIFGRNSICPGLSTDYHLINAPTNLGFAWGVDGGLPIFHIPARDTITVAWGDSVRTDAAVVVTAALTTDTVVCYGNPVRLTVRINPILRAPLPQGPLCINLSSARSRFFIDSLPGSTYVWGLSGAATLQSGQGTGAVQVTFNRRGWVQLWIDEQINNTACAGPSDTIRVRVLTAPTDPGTITGDTSLCLNDTATFRFNPAFTDTHLSWSVIHPGFFDTTAGDSTRVVFPQSGPNRVAVQEIIGQCLSTPQLYPVNVHPLPEYAFATADSILCPEALSGHNYRLATSNPIRFTWHITGGQITGAGIDSTSISVNWLQSPYLLTAIGTNSFGCPGKPLVLTPKVDSSRIRLAGVSHVEDNNQDLLFRVGLVNGFKDGSRPGSLQRLDPTQPGADWQEFSPFAFTLGETRYMVPGLYQPELRYAFRILSMRACGLPETSEAVSPIYLQVSGDEAPGAVQGRFSPHRGPVELGLYNLRRTTDASPWAFVQEYTPSDTIIALQGDGRLGFDLCYRLYTEFEDDSYLLSNRACASFQNLVSIPNILTPNGDGLNDVLKPGNLALYQGSYKLEIRNRWGKQVLKTTTYQRTWPFADTPAGIYFYRLVYPKGELKGWIEIVDN